MFHYFFISATESNKELYHLAKQKMSKQEQKSSSGGDAGDLSSGATLMKRMGAVLKVATDKLQVEQVTTTEMNMALKFYIEGIHGNKKYQDIRVDLLEKHIFESDLGSTTTTETTVETVKHDELVALEKYFHLAQIAYEEDTDKVRSQLKEHGYELHTHFINEKAGEVGYYSALAHDTKTLLIGVKGTSSLADAMTDAVAVPMPHVCTPSCPFGGSDNDTEIRCHEGILTAALHLFDQLHETIKQVALRSGYKIRICGHSLGAGTAALLGVLLRTNESEQLRDPENLRVYAVAPPPVLDFLSSQKVSSFITTVVNKSDVVPRLSMGNLEVLVKQLNDIAMSIRTDHNKGQASYYMPLALHKTNKLITQEKNEGFDDDKINKIQGKMMECLSSAEVESIDNLYIPGRIIVFYEKKNDTVVDPLVSTTDCSEEDGDKAQELGTGAVVVGPSHWVRNYD
jgi:hypothetical protein